MYFRLETIKVEVRKEFPFPYYFCARCCTIMQVHCMNCLALTFSNISGGLSCRKEAEKQSSQECLSVTELW